MNLILYKPEIYPELEALDFHVTIEQLQTVVTELMLPTSSYFKVKHRQWINHFLREIFLSRKKYGLSVRLPQSHHDGSQCWPDEIQDRDDLLSSFTTMSLRADVKSFIWKVLDEVIPNDKCCNMHYFGAIQAHRSNS